MLIELIGQSRSLSIIGMCKNAGKTTALNRIISEMHSARRLIGVTSIGRDGEGVDIVTRTHKPGIYVYAGTLAATAANLLRHCDISREIIDATNIHTPLGEVVLFRAKSDGRVQLAGPSITRQLTGVIDLLYEHGAELVIIDGAVSRKSLGAPAVCEAVILCTGASYSTDINVVVDDTAHEVNMLSLPGQDVWADDETGKLNCEAAIKMKSGECVPVKGGAALADVLRIRGGEGVKNVYLGGAVTDALLDPIIAAGMRLDGISFTLSDGTKALFGRERYDKLVRLGAGFAAMNTINLVAVTVNPVSAYGYNFDKTELQTRLQERVGVPVVDVGGETW